MQNDTISRSALIAELERFKLSIEDIFLQFLVNWIIRIIKALPAVEETV